MSKKEVGLQIAMEMAALPFCLCMDLQQNHDTQRKKTIANDNKDDENPQSLCQILKDAIGDAIKVLDVGHDNGGWHSEWMSSFEGKSSKKEDKTEK